MNNKTAILFDLDGTLIPMNHDEFVAEMFSTINTKFEKMGKPNNYITNTFLLSIKNMYNNNGNTLNKNLFWDTFKNAFPKDYEVIKNALLNYYENEFKLVKNVVKQKANHSELINFCKQNFDYVILATNPFFPETAVQTRLKWMALSVNDFDYVTTFDNSHYAKPNVNYYKEILNKFSLQPQNCIMVGNDELEDYIAASSIGIKTILAGDFVISRNEMKNKVKPVKLKNLITEIKKIKTN